MQFTVRPGTTEQLRAIGVRNASKDTASAYPEMPLVQKEWKVTNAQFKSEGNVTNIGLGTGDALDTFNNNIVGYDVVRF